MVLLASLQPNFPLFNPPHAQVYPLLTDLVKSLHCVTHLPPDFRAKTLTKGWLTKLHGRPAYDQLTEEEERQLLFDLESAYNDFMGALPKGSGV